MADEWYIATGDGPAGPYDRGLIAAWIERGELSRTAAVWREGLAEWGPANELLLGEDPLAAAAKVANRRGRSLRAARARDARGRRITAGVLSILLPGLGLGYFAAGAIAPGLLMLVWTAANWKLGDWAGEARSAEELGARWVIVGVSMALMCIFGLVRGIVWLAMRDEDFASTWG
jgi:hypothetical protein